LRRCISFDLIGQKDPPASRIRGFFYGVRGVGLAWQMRSYSCPGSGPIPPLHNPLNGGKIITESRCDIGAAGTMHASDLVFAGTDLLLGCPCLWWPYLPARGVPP